MKPIALAGLIAISAVALGQTKTHSDRKPYDPKRDAAADIDAAIKRATRDNKRIILDVGGEWCPWCKKLDNFFLENVDAANYLKRHYVVVKVNWSEENKNEKVLSRYGKVESFPHLFVLDKSGKLLQSQDTGELESGDHHDHDKVMTFLKKWG